MAVYGYHRVSTKQQHLDRGIAEILEFCKNRNLSLTGDVYCDKQTGTNFDRPEYQFIKHRILPGDILIISELDRFGRTKKEIIQELDYFVTKGVRVMILEIPTTLMDFSGMDNALATIVMETINKMLLEIFALLAESEMEKRKKRQREGIAEKKKRGEWEDYGRPAKITYESFYKEYREVLAGRITGAECARRLGIGKTTYYRYKQVADKEIR